MLMPRTPLQESASDFDRRGARAMEHGARPPARFSSLPNQEIVNTNKSHGVTPFWHNDTHPRVTVTFGARRSHTMRGAHDGLRTGDGQRRRHWLRWLAG